MAFIALDNQENSLLEMRSIQFGGGKPVFHQYLDSFPFPYYVLLREVDQLPQTLCDLLKQWFELTAAGAQRREARGGMMFVFTEDRVVCHI